MRLMTLGGLQLDSVSFGRPKPLSLLAYMAIEGPQERRYLAEIFWPHAKSPRDSLTQALKKLAKALPDYVDRDEVRPWTRIQTDVHDLLTALNEGDTETALEIYTGPFFHGVSLTDCSVELEEWVYAKREDIAARMQRALIKLAESKAAQGNFDAATRYAEQAHLFEHAPEPEPEALIRLFTLLHAGESYLAPQVREEAAFYDIDLNLSVQEARSRLQRTLIGRDAEQARLHDLMPGEWAWVRGGAGMGKTSLLKSIDGVFLPGRIGLPYASLEPLLGDTIQDGESSILQKLRQQRSSILIDDWERVDDESQQILKRLHDLGTNARIIVSSRKTAPFKTDVLIDLQTIPKQALERYPGAWEKTQGLPSFIEAYLRNDPLHNVLEDKLTSLAPESQQLYFALTLTDNPDTALVRRALELDASTLASGLEELLSIGLIEPSGQVRVRQAALEYLEERPTLLGPLCLRLARVLGSYEAFPLYQKSRHLWAQEDEPKAVESYLVWAKALIERGFPQRAVDTLADIPEDRAVALLKARAFERAGRYHEAFACLASLDKTPEVLALQSTLYYRLGKPDEAKIAAEGALNGSMEARAEALNTLGHQARFNSQYTEAARYFRRAAALWQAQGNRLRWADALNNLGIAQYYLNEDSEQTLQEALAAAGNNPAMRARVLTNLGIEYDKQGKLDKAIETYLTAINESDDTVIVQTQFRLWNNLGWIYQRQNKKTDALNAYTKALELAQKAGEPRAYGLALSSLAELSEDYEAWCEAEDILIKSGNMDVVERARENLPESHPFRFRSDSNF